VREYPILYYYKRLSESDRGFILKRMVVVPEEHKNSVSLKYESLYLKNGRKAANEYLHGIAKGFRDGQ